MGSIPALAGERRHDRRLKSHLWVYPRACGGTLTGAEGTEPIKGLSPRLRGNGDTGRQTT